MIVTLLLILCAFTYLILWKVIDMSKLVDDLVASVAEIATAVNALEAVVTDLKSKIAGPADTAKLEQALADPKAAVADAGDGVDESVVVPPAP
jgi:hypothetical protein